MDIDLTAHAPSERYHLLTQAVIPRPVAWILTADEKGITNLAPFSFFAPVCSDPATFVVSVGYKPDGKEKDTYNNLRSTGVCVVHIAAADQAEVLNQSSATLAAGDSEVDAFGIDLEEVQGWTLPVVKDTPVAFLCRYQQQVDLGDSAQHILFLEVKRVFLKEGVAEIVRERLVIDSEKVNPLARLGAAEYSELGRRMKIRRPG